MAPATVAIAALVTSVISTGAAVYGQMQAASAAEDAADYNAKVAEQNAETMKQKADYDIELHREKVRKLLSSNRAAVGASGVTMEGSPLLVAEDITRKSAEEENLMRWNSKVGIGQQLSSAAGTRLAGSQQATASRIGAGSSLLTGIGDIASKYGTYSKFQTPKAGTT